MLIGGEAGIGKTALAEAVCREASEQGALVLTGRCYDLSETPPYGPWIELFGQYQPGDDLPALPAAFAHRIGVGETSSQATLFNEVRAFIATVAAIRPEGVRPLVLLLDDLHWADPASLDLLRFFSRFLAPLPLLIIATYRADEINRGHPLYQLLPMLERESPAVRLDLRRLPVAAIRTLVALRYHLPDADAARLVDYLHARAEGNAFFVTQLLRAIEEEDVLRLHADMWTLRDLSHLRVPIPLRQVIDGRLARLGEQAHTLLAVAAVIGQDVPPDVWATVAGANEETLSLVIEQATTAHLLDEAPDTASIRFVHALVRETLYEGISVMRRRIVHRRVGETLAVAAYADPDAVAYHFRNAGDARATEWLIAAGQHAERAFAWRTAADRYEAAARFLAATGTDERMRGWLCYSIGWMRRFASLPAGIAALEEAVQIAGAVDDPALAALALSALGTLRCRVDDFRRGLAELERALATIETISERVRLKIPSFIPRDVAAFIPRDLSASKDRIAHPGSFILWLAFAGRYAEARTLGEQNMAEAASAPHRNHERHGGYLGVTHFGLGLVYTALGQPMEAQAAFGRALVGAPSNNPIGDANAAINALEWVIMPYRTDLLAMREAAAAQIEGLIAQAIGALADTHPRDLAYLSLWVLEGRWAEARVLATQGYVIEGNANSRLIATRALGALSYHQGESDRAWALVRSWLPDGPITEPGGAYFLDTLVMQRLAARLAVDAGDLESARAWLEAHDRWLAWGGGTLGQSEGNAVWAMYHRASGDRADALDHARAAVQCATEPRQPLALLAAHRLLGELETDAGNRTDAETHLAAALTLSEACAAPYERALTLLAFVALHLATGDSARAATLLGEARAICLPLGAKPALAHADALADRLAAMHAPLPFYPDHLTTREVDVLRLIASGSTNQEIAATLFLSIRTVERHITSVYRKTETRGRAGIAAYALRHGLITD